MGKDQGAGAGYQLALRGRKKGMSA